MLTLKDIYKSCKIELTDERKKLISRAFEFAQKAHQGQKRRSGEDYFQHCVATAKILAEIGMGSKTISAGLLHDVPEDTEITLAEIEKEFGKDIYDLVKGITKLGKIKLRETKEEYLLENLRKMFLAMAEDIRVVIIKLADRLHNMRTLEFNPPDKQQRIANETMEIYVPLADRLGIGEIKSELENLSFKFLDPENYEKLKEMRDKYYKEGEQYVKQAIKELERNIKKKGVEIIEIYGRAKQLYSLFLKLKRHEMDIGRIYDLIAIRIIVPSVADCYETLGIVHRKYRPMVGRIKDYISLPKPNGYQSIHTTIFGPKGKIMEVQIRTKKMHDEAEFGIASHWIYNENKRRSWKNYFRQKETYSENELLWLKQLREWQNEVGKNSQEFMEGLKIDFFKHRIFAITPQGDAIDLPEDATPIDFAYAIHSEIGDSITGAKVDGKMVPLDYKIRNGQMVEILKSKEKKLPNAKWLDFVKTSNAKN
ncbi:MAG TPA: bifunctional (p)ppGpp synthetase/guanosine-3',5'-bis(diphosphate) 3'-pyrophosphohydrolase, partial [Candidatus Moranbacteria bacterium]|nr:bifunctional (p)ppGpp synthetase/guanosine-3',5'-bis(diphosphate) 3'-pyrophosphohydrolase [Candidatus Moranbacteria bacterium]